MMATTIRRSGSPSRGVFVMMLVLALGCASPATAEAGLLDSITGFFGKAADTVKGWFSGGGEKDFVKMLQDTVQSQEELSEKQANLQEYYQQRSASGINPGDPVINERLNDIAQASRTNEALYLKLLKARDELKQSKKDLSKYEEVLDQITERQNSIEQQYQQLQEFNRENGAFTPPAKIASSGAKGSTLGSGGFAGTIDWRNEQVQAFIDEWLRANNLTEWGVYLAPGAMSAGPPDHGSKQRHEWIWENMQAKSAGSNITLADYVRSRLKGEVPKVSPAKIAASFTGPRRTGGILRGSSTRTGSGSSTRVAATSSSSSAQTGAIREETKASSIGSVAMATELKDVNDQEKSILAAIQKANTDGQGNSEAVRQLYESLKAIQARKKELIRQSTGSIESAR